MDKIQLQVRYQIVENDIDFRDALYFSQDEFDNLAPETLEQMKRERFENYKTTLTNTPTVPTPTGWHDIGWSPVSESTLVQMLDVAEVTEADTVLDLGSGDGRILFGASARGANGIGIEYDDDLLAMSRAVNNPKVNFYKEDFLSTSEQLTNLIKQATVVTMYLTPEIMFKILPILSNLKTGTKVVYSVDGISVNLFIK